MTQLEKSVEMIMQSIRAAYTTPEQLNVVHGALLEANHVLKTKLDKADTTVYDTTEGEEND